MVLNNTRTNRPVNIPNYLLAQLGAREDKDVKQLEYVGRAYRVNINGVDRYVTSDGKIIK